MIETNSPLAAIVLVLVLFFIGYCIIYPAANRLKSTLIQEPSKLDNQNKVQTKHKKRNIYGLSKNPTTSSFTEYTSDETES